MIRITKQTDYGLVLLTSIARGAGHTHTARDLAAETNIPLPMVGKVLKALAHEGLLISHRGVKGGYALARPAPQISVSEIINALEGPIALTECLSETASDCQLELLCPTRTNWWKINEAIRSALDAITLADMVEPFSSSFVTFTGLMRGAAHDAPALEHTAQTAPVK